MGFLEDRDLSDVPSIPEYYKGKTLFITGGSGFMGKILIEKLLYSCTELDRLYLLLRSKKGVTPEQRLADLYNNAIFGRLRAERPGVFESKVFFIAGDCSQIGLGMSEEDRTLLINRVNIIFHVAASVRFDEPLKVAARLNLRGAKEVIELAEEIRNLEVMVHVSTSYSNTNRDPIEEILYPPLADWKETLKICEKFDDNTVQVITPKYLGEMPNTYVFTKQLAEQLVFDYKGKLPIAIIRPSIVIPCAKEPIPGWIDNFNGPVGLIVGGGKGLIRYFYTRADLVSDFIPVDVCIKNFIAVAWIRGTKKMEPTDDVPIYNCCSNTLMRWTIRETVDIGRNIVKEMPIGNMLWTCGGRTTGSKFFYFLVVIFLHLLPAVLVDTALRLLGKKPKLVKIQRRIYLANMAIEYYLTQQWTFTNNNFVNLRSKLKPEDKEQFYYDIENIDKEEFFKNSIIAGRQYLLKETPEETKNAPAHFKRITFLDGLLKILFFAFLIWKITNSQYIQNLLQDVLNGL